MPIGGYPNYRSSLISSLNSGGHLGPLSPLGGIGPFSLGGLGALPLLSSLRSDTKFLSRSSPIYEPTVASSSIVPSYAAVVAPPAPLSSPAAAPTSSFLITSPASISSALGTTNPLTAAAINSLLPTSAFAQPHLSAAAAAAASTSHQSPAISPHPLLASPSANTISNANSLSLTNSSPLTNNPTFSNSNLSNSHLFSYTNPTLLTSSNATTYSNAASSGNSLTDKTMTGSQGELIKQELKEHHLNNIRIQYLKSLRDHLIRDQQLKEQYLKELTKKSSIVYPYLEMYEELGNRKK